MATVTIRVIGDKRLVQHLTRMRAAIPHISANAWKYAAEQLLIPAIKQRIIDNESVFTRDLLNSFAISSGRKRGTDVVVTIESSKSYASVVELGGPPRSEPFERIKDWIKVKNKITDELEATRMAAIIVNSIRSKGTEAHPYIEPAFKATAQIMMQVAATKIKAGLRNP